MTSNDIKMHPAVQEYRAWNCLMGLVFGIRAAHARLVQIRVGREDMAWFLKLRTPYGGYVANYWPEDGSQPEGHWAFGVLVVETDEPHGFVYACRNAYGEEYTIDVLQELAKAGYERERGEDEP